MANLSWLILFMAVYKCVDGKVVSGLYCKDPATGMLHAINSTWPSKSFCGSYVCRLRKRNATEFEFEAGLKKNDTNDTTFPYDTETQNSMIKETFVLPNETEIFKDEKNYVRINSTKFFEEPILEENDMNNDRYLTNDEIITISKLLHTVKRNDLDSLIEIYNLAKDIYKEIDGFETEDGSGCDETNTNCSASENPKTSNNAGENTFENDDMEKSSTNQYSSLPRTQYYSTNPGMNKVPYYYPMSPFQKYSSYVYDPYAQYRNNPPVHAADSRGVPCNHTTDANYYAGQYSGQGYTPWVNRVIKKLQSANKMYEPSLLPYPFSSIYHYNPDPKDVYFDGKTWKRRTVNEMQISPFSYMKPDLPTAQKITKNYETPVYYPSVVPNYSKEAKMMAYNDEVYGKDPGTLEGYEDKAYESIKNTPTWKTDPLTSQVLDEVRANIMDKTASIISNKVKKSPKLEKIGKLLRLDTILRKKRNINVNDTESNIIDKGYSGKWDDDEYEATIDKVLCETSLELGYFKYGNLTEPYPACCPQKI